MSNNLNQGASIEAAPLESYSPEDRAFYEFWYSHMLEDLMQPPLIGIAHSTARYIWDAARRTPADAVGAGELPPLPKHDGLIDTYHDDATVSSQDGYTAEKVLEYGRQCIAADRAQRKQAGQIAVPSEVEKLKILALCGVDDLERVHVALGLDADAPIDADVMVKMIVDLRAQLAAKAQDSANNGAEGEKA
jgi:hypothetical protein